MYMPLFSSILQKHEKKRLAGFDAIDDIIDAESIEIDVSKRGGGAGRGSELAGRRQDEL